MQIIIITFGFRLNGVWTWTDGSVWDWNNWNPESLPLTKGVNKGYNHVAMFSNVIKWYPMKWDDHQINDIDGYVCQGKFLCDKAVFNYLSL